MKPILSMALACLALPSAAAGAERNWHEVKSWVYHLCNYKDDRLDEIAGSDFDLAVIDLARDGAAGYFTRQEIDAVKASGTFVLAYFEIGAIENYRPEWNEVPDELKAGPVGGWPKEQYVKYWDARWWPIVRGRMDRALKAGFDGAYLDMVTTYEEIPKSGLGAEERGRRMVDLIARLSAHAKAENPAFKIVPQNCPELYTWSPWKPAPNKEYIDAIDGLGLESVFYLAHDKPADKGWCRENRENALAIRKAGKLVLGVDYAKKPECIADAYKRQRELGFVPYVGVEALDSVRREGERADPPAAPAPVIKEDRKNHGPLDGHPVEVVKLLEKMSLPPDVLARCRKVARTSQQAYRAWYRENRDRVEHHNETIRKLKTGDDKQALKKAQAEKKTFMHTAPSLLRNPAPLDGIMSPGDHTEFLKRLEALKVSLHKPAKK
jgi:uncharacterized protein (TIGR01370 family)